MLNKEELEEINRKLTVFSFGRLQELVTLFEVLDREGISLEKLKSFIKSSLERQKFQEAEYRAAFEYGERQWIKNAPKCPICKSSLRLYKIREPEGKGNLHGFTCLWYCPDEECGHEEYTKEDFEEIYKKIMEG